MSKRETSQKNRLLPVVIVFVFAAKTVFFADTKTALAEKRTEARLELDNPPFEPLPSLFGDATIAKVLALKNLATSGSERISSGVYAVGNSVISSTDQFATVGESVAEAARRFYCTVSGWLGVGCEVTNESISPVFNQNNANPRVDVQVTPPVINRREDQSVEFNIDVRKEYNSSDDATSNDSNVVNQTVIVNGITETELERRLAIFKSSLDLSSGVTVVNRSQENDNVNTDRIYETIDEASENAVIGGELSFNGINGTFSGDVSVAGALVVGGSAGTSGYVLQSTGTSAQWVATSTLGIVGGSGGSGVDALAAIGSTANACGASISGTTLTLQPASATFGGVVTTDAQTFAGAKTFSSNLTLSGTSANLVTGSNWLSSDGDDEGLYIDSTGKVGIGTTTLNNILHVYAVDSGTRLTRDGTLSGAETVLNIVTPDTGTLIDGDGGGISFRISDADQAELSIASVTAVRSEADNSGALRFQTANAGSLTTKMTIAPSGHVGIGTCAPDKALEVNLGTTNALRLSYDDVNGSAATYFDTTLSSTGVVTFNTTGSAPSFMFNDAINLSVIEVGNGNNASGATTSAALGYQNTLTSASSTAVGVSNTVSGVCASAIGSCNTAGGVRSSAIGRSNTTSECNTSAFGYNNTACGELASAFGYQNVASTTSSSAFGQSNIASGISASVFGRSSIASGGCSTAIGRLSCSTGGFSTAVGNLSVAGGNESSAFGFVSTASGAYSSALGYCNGATALNSVSIGRSNFSGTGPASVNIGILNNSAGTGEITLATGVITGAPAAVNSGASSVALGICNCSTGLTSATVGHFNKGTAQSSLGFGNNNNVTGACAAGFGHDNTVSNTGAFAVGKGNTVSGACSYVFGHNITNSTDSVEIGMSNTAKIRINSSGVDFINAGFLVCGSAGTAGQVLTSSGANAAPTWTTISGGSFDVNAIGVIQVGCGNSASGYCASAFGAYNNVSGFAATAVGAVNTTEGTNSVAIGGYNHSCENAIAAGYCNIATGLKSSAFGHMNQSFGSGSTASGYCNTASGYVTTASGAYNDVTGQYSSTFGYDNCATGYGSTAVGAYTSAIGECSSAFGYGITNSQSNSVLIGPANEAALHICSTGSAGIFQFIGSGAIENLELDSSGFFVNGGTSDERLKNIDGAFTAGLSELNDINPISFHWKDISGRDTNRMYSGFSAQNILATIPEAVTLGNDGYYSVKDRPILAASVNAIKQLNVKSLTTDALALQNAADIVSIKTLLGTEGMSTTTLARFETLDVDVTNVHVIMDAQAEEIVTLSDRMDEMVSRLESFGATVYESIVTFVDVIARKITASEIIINNEEHPEKTGLVIYDRKTGEPICIYFENGEMKTQEGECEEVEENDADDNTEDNAETQDENSNDTSDEPTTDTEGDSDVVEDMIDDTESDTPVTDEGDSTTDESDTSGDTSDNSGVDSGSEIGDTTDSGASTDTSDTDNSDTNTSTSDTGSDSSSDTGGDSGSGSDAGSSGESSSTE